MTGLSDPQITPDGAFLVVVRKVVGEKNKTESSLWIAPVDGTIAPRPLTGGLRDSLPRIAPDGRAVAFVRGGAGQPSQIALIPFDGGEARVLTRFPEGSYRSIAWSPDGTRLAVSFRATEPEWTEAAKKERERTGAVEPPRILESRWHRLDGDGWFGCARHALFIVDVATGRAIRVYDEDAIGHFDLSWSPDGRRIALATNRAPDALLKPWKTEILLLDVASGTTTPLDGLPIGPKSSIAWSPDGRMLAWAGRKGRDGLYSTENLELWVAGVPGEGRGSSARRGRGGATSTALRPRSLTHQFDGCLAAGTLSDAADAAFDAVLRWRPDGTGLLTRIGRHGEGHLVEVPLDGSQPRFLTEGPYEHALGSVSADGRRIAAIRTDATTPVEAGVLELARGRGGRDPARAAWRCRTAFNAPLVAELDLATPTAHWIEAEDGHRSQIWVMLPPPSVLAQKKGAKRGRGGRNERRPAILEIHGGPHAQYGVSFFHEFQVLAAEGWVVVYGNPRGSKGYGRDHCAAIRGSWGDRDWADVQATIRFMQSHPAIDPARLGIMGGSYGGYMTNWAIAHTKAFKAAITDRCVANMLSFCGNSDYPLVPDEYWPGTNFDRPERLWEASPIKHFKGVSTPTLIIHSEGDFRCNIEQAEQVHSALVLQGVPCRFVRYPMSTSHGMSRSGPPELRLHRLGEITAWWSRWL
jgi:dipeptidyl aminopeptidase/acylaminoacyl peptidase